MAFDKVREELNTEGVKAPSVNQCAKKLSLIISETFPYGDRSLRDFYNVARNNPSDSVDIPQPQVVNALANYLGYKNFMLLNKDIEDQNSELSQDHNKERDRNFGFEKDLNEKGVKEKGLLNIFWGKQRKNKKPIKVIIGAFLLIILAGTLFIYLKKPNWMIWNKDHYEIVPFKAEKIESSELKIYNKNHFENQKRIIPTCETQFFNPDGSELIWYGKNSKKELEYFTVLGKHPETGKALKPITKYMIHKYICPGESN